MPTGTALIVESDSEEECEKATQINAPRTLPAVTATANVSCCVYMTIQRFKKKNKQTLEIHIEVNETVVTS